MGQVVSSKFLLQGKVATGSASLCAATDVHLL